MFVLIFVTVIFLIGCFFYLSVSKYYTNKQYILMEVDGDNKKIKIRGNYIDITYGGEHVRIEKKLEDKWCYINNEGEKSLKNGETFQIGNKKFKIKTKETKGGFWALFPLIITLATICLLYQQGRKIINNENEHNKFAEENATLQDDNKGGSIINNENENNNIAEEKSEYPTQQNENIGDITDNKETITDDEVGINDKDIHSIVQKYDVIFQNNISINWNAYVIDENMRRSLSDNFSEAGISISEYQGIIDWKKVKSDDINYAIIRVGSRGYKGGSLRMDSKFKENVDGAIANNIKLGAYFFSQAINQKEMDEEIEMILQSLKGYAVDYPIGIGFERKDNYRTNDLSDKESIELIKYFCIRMKQNGYTPMIMGTEKWFLEFPDKTFDGYLKLVSSKKSISNKINNCIIWEYEENAEGVNGINGKFELSVSGYVDENNDIN